MDCMFPENTEIPEKYIRKCIRSIPKQHGFLLEYKNNYGRFQFWVSIFENVCAERNITCESAGGKTKIPEMIGKAGTEETCIIADGAAIGAEMNLLSNKIEEKQNVHLYLPESFEWLILNSDLLQDKEVRKILENPEDYIDSTEFLAGNNILQNC